MKFEYETYLEAKFQASNFLKEEQVVGVRIYRKKYEHKWIIEVTKCSDEFFNKFIYKEQKEC